MKKFSVLFLTAALILSAAVMNSCQKEDDLFQGEPILKGAVEGIYDLTFPGKVYTGEAFSVNLSLLCGDAVLMQGYILGDPILDELGEETGEFEKVYSDLGCDTENLLWEEVLAFHCDGGSYTATLAAEGIYVYKLVVAEPGLESLCAVCAEETVYPEECFTITACRKETAFGGDNWVLPKNGGWFWYYAPVWNETELVWEPATVWANQDEVAGTVQLVETDGVYSLEITLNEGWSLREGVTDAVKVQGLSAAPAKRLTGKQYSYKGTDLSVAVDLKSFYMIHLDLEICPVAEVEIPE